MSLYNMINGVNPATFFFLPMLGEKHPDNYPRFRDCFVGEVTNSPTDNDEFGIPKKVADMSRKVLSVYTRVGGGNREAYAEEISQLQKMPTYIKDYDDTFDSTFAYFIFEIPKEWEKDFDLISAGQIKNASQEYKTRLYSVYPKLKDTFDKIFND